MSCSKSFPQKIVVVGEIIWMIVSVNYAVMFITVFIHYGGSPSPTQGGGINNKGEYVLASHGRATMVSKSQYNFSINYFIISTFLLIIGIIILFGVIPYVPEHNKYSLLDKISRIKVNLKWLKK
jgi:hypothetical protein